MRIAIIGSGGVGGFFGAKLAKGGADVTFPAALTSRYHPRILAIKQSTNTSVGPTIPS
jgi:ketopantoate reductase